AVQQRGVAGALEEQGVAPRKVAQAGQRIGQQREARVQAQQLHGAGGREVLGVVVAKQRLAGGGIGQGHAHLLAAQRGRAVELLAQPGHIGAAGGRVGNDGR
nr:hypothetical protein [Tanacetum cinerariifolium]